MKTNRGYQRRSLIIASVVCLAAFSAFGEVLSPPSGSLQMIRATNKHSAKLTLTNLADQVWIIQSSSNMVNWTEYGAWKIHNGMFQQTLTAPTGPLGLYFRAYYDAARQNIPSATTNALLLPATPYNYASPTLPPNFANQPILGQDNMPATNVTSNAGATLGRALFYDKRLSTNFSVSCSSCHQQKHGFSDSARFSTGFGGGLTSRNSMGLSNARWYQRGHFFWDERANTLEDQVLKPIQNATEMGMTLDLLTNRIAAEPYYTNLFTLAFGSPTVTTNRISLALAQFVRSIISVKSKYDVGAATGFANFTAQEIQGRQIFLGQNGSRATCAACHGTDNFVPGAALNNNGLEFPYVDTGVGGITGNQADNGKFKVPSLRNIELTTPYMHDGRFATLEEVVEFYNSGVVDNPNLSPPLRTPPGPGQPNGGVLRLNLTPDQKAALVAFLKTLTDTNLATDPTLSDPFNYGN